MEENSSRIYIRGLPPSLSVEEFRKHFSNLSPITDAKFIPHRRIGYVGYKSSQDAERAVKYHNKTFIRMSRIGVEIARSVQGQQALKQQDNAANRGGGVSNGREGARDRIEEESSHHFSNKSKQDQSQREEKDPKLQEFLQVMAAPSRSRIWEDDEGLAVKVLETNRARNSVAAPDHDADRSRMDRETDAQKEDSPRKRRKIEQGYVDGESRPLAGTAQESEPTEQQQQQRQGQLLTTDEDWLRSRTNRVLDLVDDGHVGTTKPNAEVDKQLNSEVKGADSTSTNGEQSTDEPEMEKVPDKTLEHGVSNEPTLEVNIAPRRLFLRNLAYSTTENELRHHFEDHGFGEIVEVHLPTDSRSNQNKGFAHIEFRTPEIAGAALEQLDQKPLQGRLLHILPSEQKKQSGPDEFAISKLPLKKQQLLRRRADAGSFTFNWNSMYMSSDAIMSSVSNQLGLQKSGLLDPTSSDAAIRQAHAETHVIQEAKAFFVANGVDVEAFKRHDRGSTVILIKNFPFGTRTEELRKLFEAYGPLKKLLMPEAGTIAIVEFEDEAQARSAFHGLAYRKINGSILFLEKAPKNLFKDGQEATQAVRTGSGHDEAKTKASARDFMEPEQSSESKTSTLFVRSLNFSTSDDRLREAFRSLDGFLSAHIKTKPDPKNPGQMLSMGFGFLEFRSTEQAQAALEAMQGYKLDGFDLVIRPSQRTIDAAEERRKADRALKAAGRKTKIIIKNLPFEATKKDVRSLFGAYGQLRSVRAPRKFDGSTRGFAFANFITAREAENAMDALRDTHLLGRKLVLEFAADDVIDPELEIAQMQQKVGRQADKVALQKLTGTGRKKFNVEGVEDGDE